MLNILANEPQRFCDALSRRRVLEVGGLGTLGLSVPGLLRGTLEAAGHADGFGLAKRMILLFMWGGPAHQDTWDLKPEGPLATRGEFLPIATNVSGLQVGPIPQGDISAIPYPLSKAFDLGITAPGWKLTGLAVVGEKIHRRHLEIGGIV